MPSIDFKTLVGKTFVDVYYPTYVVSAVRFYPPSTLKCSDGNLYSIFVASSDGFDKFYRCKFPSGIVLHEKSNLRSVVLRLTTDEDIKLCNKITIDDFLRDYNNRISELISNLGKLEDVSSKYLDVEEISEDIKDFISCLKEDYIIVKKGGER